LVSGESVSVVDDLQLGFENGIVIAHAGEGKKSEGESQSHTSKFISGITYHYRCLWH
jgi:hypothetical protein